MLIYIRDNTNLGLGFYAKIEYALLSDLLKQASIKIENQLMVLSNSSWEYYPNSSRITGAYIVFYQGVTINQFPHVTGPVSK